MNAPQGQGRFPLSGENRERDAAQAPPGRARGTTRVRPRDARFTKTLERVLYAHVIESGQLSTRDDNMTSSNRKRRRRLPTQIITQA